MQRRPSSRSASKARSATPVSTIAMVSASAGRPLALEGAVVEAVEGELLDRGPGAVGVEADLAEEDPVGPGDRPFAQLDRVGAVEAVGEVAQAPAHRLRAPAGARRRPRPRRSPGRGTRRRGAARPSPARARAPTRSALGRGSAPSSARLRRRGRLEQALDPCGSARRRSSSPMLALCSVPPGIDVGEGRAAADPVEAGDGAVAVVADRHPPAALADQVANRVAIVAHVQREEVHPPTVALVDRARPRPAARRSCSPLREPERDHQRAVEEVADADRLRGVDPAGGGAAGVLGAGNCEVSQSSWATLASPSSVAGGARARRTRAAASASAAGRGRACRLLPRHPRLDRGDDDHREEDQADDDRVAVSHRLLAPAQGGGQGEHHAQQGDREVDRR